MSKLTKNNGGAPQTGYRLDKHNAKLFGVCSGLANLTDIDATIWRIGLVIATLLGVGLTIPIYLAVALIAD
ncbi:PspC domain-containing protein [Erythrobacter sp. F6033]|uniref:PspC domain-containing protein n=1 Tax=Erythrobacter sp. F6033 TaxID=2926401 RepID=UPI001FF45D07|nr:PspC domain-containing protein [Erythrobacter sp. F6033]MCK0127825.1 PspC domain-containing protein [Erythrobacter sp. F6033]